MDFTAQPRVARNRTIINEDLSVLYPHDLNMYSEDPISTLPLSEFEDIAMERLQLLRILEQASLKGHKLFSEDWRNCVKEDANKHGLKKYVWQMNSSSTNTESSYQARRVDHISHFILRLAYCRSEELRRWFLSRELEWFKMRFITQTPESIKNFLRINKLSYTPISDEEKSSIREELIASTAGLQIFETTDFYKVYFTEVCSLVRARKVFLKFGYAYIPSSELVVCIQSKFRAQLSEALNVYNRRFPLLDDDRILPLISNLHNAHTGNNYYSVREDQPSIDPANLDLYSKKHFPLCMRHMHQVLRSEHHLKHQCRLSYGLFLKGIGLLYEDALKLWRDEFTKKMDANKFEKEHVYNIKHQYGKVGGMVNYSPYSCIKMIMGSVGPGEHHGCPFKHWDPTVIKQKMIEYGIGGENANEIKELVSNGHYQVACGKYFEYTHGKPASNGINHPNQYYEESMNLEKEKLEKK